MKARSRDILVLTLPADPDLAALTRLVSNHFFRQNGIAAAAARRGAGVVEKRCRPLLKAAGRDGGRAPAGLVLSLRAQATGHLGVFGRWGGEPETCLVSLPRTGADTRTGS